MDEEEVFVKIKRLLSEVLDVEDEEIERDSSLLDDLGIESIDLLNITLRLENEFNIKIGEGELWNVGLDFVENPRYIKGEMLTRDGLVEIKRRFPSIDLSKLGDGEISFYDAISLITVEMIVDYVIHKLENI